MAAFKWLKLIGFLLFIAIAFHVDWGSFFNTLLEVKLGYVALYLLFFAVSVAVRVFRLKLVLRSIGKSASLFQLYRCVVEPSFFGMVTPGRLGELSKVMCLEKCDVGRKQSLVLVILERLVDLAVMLAAGGAGLIFFFENQLLGGALLCFLFLLILVALQNLNVYWFLICKCASMLRFSFPFLSIDPSFLKTGASIACHCFFPTSIVVIVLAMAQLWMLGLAIGVGEHGLLLGVAYLVATVISLIPISVGGLGTREVVFISILATKGVSSDIAVAVSLLDGVALGMVGSAMLMLPVWWRDVLNRSN